MTINDYKSGDACPKLCGGKIYPYKNGVLTKIIGHNIATVTNYHIDKLRCALCGYLMVASLPQGVNRDKYDYSFKSILSLQKYYVAVPFYRQAQLQSYLGLPLAASTQFDLVEQVANCCHPVFDKLKILAANGKRIHNDDTRVKILEVMKENIYKSDKERTGMYTTGIYSIDADDHQIALFMSGTQHAGENLKDILSNREPHLSPVIHMCDASSMNIPQGLKTILCNCLDHGFRKFKEALDFFPKPCLHVIKALGEIYKNDDATSSMTQHERLTYHQNHSEPIMERLKLWLEEQFDKKLVEPNSTLGEHMKYLLRHWVPLTRFLTVAGCPISNSVIERALKIPIRARKSSMFYKTRHGACIGNILTSLIYTAILADKNPFNYLNALQQHKSLVFQSPNSWFPWNYSETLATLKEAA